MDQITLFGLVAAIFTTLAFLPQVIKSFKSRQTKDISWLMLSVQSSGNGLWLVYGLMRQDIALILANAITFTLVVSLLLLKATYK